MKAMLGLPLMNRRLHMEPSFGMLVERVTLVKEQVFMED